MKIRTKLFLFIPSLVLFLHIIFFYVFQSGQMAQESYNVMMNRILLYKDAADAAKENLRLLNQYLITQESSSLKDFTGAEKKLKRTAHELKEANGEKGNDLAQKDFENLILTFLEEEKQVLHAVEQKKLESYAAHYAEAEKTDGYIQESGQNLIDMELSVHQPLYKKILRDADELGRYGLLLFTVLVLLSIGIAIWLSESITAPISRLAGAASEMAKGNFMVSLPRGNRQDEIGVLSATFGMMANNIRHHMAKERESLEKDKLVKELELKALQTQINPHFLFNTINALSKLALIEGADQTSDLAVSVSNLLRYNLQKLDQPVTLREEYEHAREYFSIQKARFRNRVSFLTEIDDKAMDQLIPCLTLQPILENAFIHGIEEMEKGAVIKLSIKESPNHVTVSISDNGSGMPPAAVEMLLKEGEPSYHEKNENPSTGIGTKNVFRRLELYYEKSGLVSIESKEKEGTAVIFALPKKKRGKGE